MLLTWASQQFGFSPARLFSAGEVGFWGEVNLNTVWQDSARTTPGAIDQPVGSWLLNTASGVTYATASGTSRPTLRQDGARTYLDFDGSNDFLVSDTITPDTDKAQVFAGVRKNSDAAAGDILGLSATPSTGSGKINLVAPHNSAAATYGFRSGGTSIRLATSPTTFPAPSLNVVAGIGDIAADVCILRVNGSAVTSVVTDQGTGNYSADVVYIGRRGGSSNAFNGRIYGLILRFGPNLTAAQIDQTEAWMNARTGAY